MAWIDLPATQGTDWQRVEFVNQFLLAINERLRVTVDSPMLWQERIAGADIQMASDVDGGPLQGPISWRLVQQAVDDLVGTDRWVMPAEESAAFDGYDELTLADLASVRAAAGVDPGGFARKYPRTIESVGDAGAVAQRAYLGDGSRVYEHDGSGWIVAADQLTGPDVLDDVGHMEPGDYIGPWIFNELRAMLNVMRWTRGFYSPTLQNSKWAGVVGQSQVTDTFAEAVAFARDDYQPNHPLAPITFGNFGQGVTTPDKFGATFGGERWKHSTQRETVDTTLAAEVDFLMQWDRRTVGIAPRILTSSIFDGANLGVPSAAEGKLFRHETAVMAAGVSTLMMASFVGSVAAPPEPDNPSTGSDHQEESYRGAQVFVVPEVEALFRWDVDGGFAYVD